MKKTILYLLYIIVISGVISCSSSWEEQYNETPFEVMPSVPLNVSSEVLEFPETSSSQQLAVSTSNYWTAKCSASWLQLSSAMGKGDAVLTVSAEANPSTTQQRTATITISVGFESRTVHVTQATMAEILQVSTDQLSYSFWGNAYEVTVSSNVNWTVTSNAGWLTVSKHGDGKAFTVNAAQNLSTQQRQATVTVRGIGLSHAIPVIQGAVSAPTLTAPNTTEVTKHTAVCRFSFTSADLDVTEYGLCYSSTTNSPDKANAQVLGLPGGGRGGDPSITISGLTSKTTYYVRAYILTGLGIQYSETVQFTTPVSVPNEDDNQTPQD